MVGKYSISRNLLYYYCPGSKHISGSKQILNVNEKVHKSNAPTLGYNIIYGFFLIVHLVSLTM